MATDKEVIIPAAPSALPAGLQKKWAATYNSAFLQCKADDENASDGDCHQAARREANRLLKVEAPTSHKEAMALPDWHCHHREEKDGVLRVVTIDGKKYSFDVPKSAEKK